MILPILALVGFGAVTFLLGGMLALRGASLRLKGALHRMLSQGRIGPVDAAELIDVLEGRND